MKFLDYMSDRQTFKINLPRFFLIFIIVSGLLVWWPIFIGKGLPIEKCLQADADVSFQLTLIKSMQAKNAAVAIGGPEFIDELKQQIKVEKEPTTWFYVRVLHYDMHDLNKIVANAFPILKQANVIVIQSKPILWSDVRPFGPDLKTHIIRAWRNASENNFSLENIRSIFKIFNSCGNTINLFIRNTVNGKDSQKDQKEILNPIPSGSLRHLSFSDNPRVYKYLHKRLQALKKPVLWVDFYDQEQWVDNQNLLDQYQEMTRAKNLGKFTITKTADIQKKISEIQELD